MEEEKLKQRDRRMAKDAQRAGEKRSRHPEASRASPRKKQKGTVPADTTQCGVEANDADIDFQQPALITGAKLKGYQLEGLQWMVSLDQNGISGILGMLLHHLSAPSIIYIIRPCSG